MLFQSRAFVDFGPNAPLRFSPMAAGEGFGAGAPETFTRSRGATLFQSRVFVDFRPNAPLRFAPMAAVEPRAFPGLGGAAGVFPSPGPEIQVPGGRADPCEKATTHMRQVPGDDPCEKATTHMSKQATHMRGDPYEKAPTHMRKPRPI